MDDASEERDLFAQTAAARPVYLIADTGVTVARVAGDRVGEFGLLDRCDPRDVASGGGGVAVATMEDVLLDPAGTGASENLAPMAFGPATAVGLAADGTVTAVSPSGDVAQSPAPDAEWTTVGQTTDPVHAVAPPFLATAGGVVRVAPNGLQPVGLTDVRDVTTDGVPRAATATGLYHLGNGWMAELEGTFDRVAARVVDRGTVAVASGGEGLFAAVEGTWESVSVPVRDQVTDVGVTGGPVAITEAGCLLLSGADGLRPHELGLRGVRGLAIP